MEETLQHFYSPLLGYIKKRVGNTLDAEDLLQDVFLKLSQSNLDEVKNLKSWLYTIARNSITDYYRKKRLEIYTLEKQYADEQEEDTDIIDELSQCIIPFIEHLPLEYSEVLKLYEIEGVPQKEIAQRLNMNYVTVRSRIQRGRVKLKALFMECCHIKEGGKGSIVYFSNKTDCC